MCAMNGGWCCMSGKMCMSDASNGCLGFVVQSVSHDLTFGVLHHQQEEQHNRRLTPAPEVQFPGLCFCFRSCNHTGCVHPGKLLPLHCSRSTEQ